MSLLPSQLGKKKERENETDVEFHSCKRQKKKATPHLHTCALISSVSETLKNKAYPCLQNVVTTH